jgi:hypothetical protein
MATTTTNYGFDIPQSTDLVKDGATAIATLGQDIDTAMNTALGTKKAGMVLLNTTSFSAVASQSINNCFTSDYTNYKLLVNVLQAGGSNQVYVRLRASGTDVSTGYFWAGSYVPTSGTATVTGFNGAGDTTFFRIAGASDANERTAADVNLFNPQASATTTFTSLTNDGNNFGAIIQTGLLNNTNSYDGFTLISQTNNITGTVQVFGYNQ